MKVFNIAFATVLVLAVSTYSCKSGGSGHHSKGHEESANQRTSLDERCRLKAPTNIGNERECRMATDDDYYYDESTQRCNNYPWSECMPRGRGQGFTSRNECERTCAIHHSVQSRSNYADPCMQPKEKGTCRASFKRFHFNVDSGMCEEFLYGGCAGNANNFETKRDCEVMCM